LLSPHTQVKTLVQNPSEAAVTTDCSIDCQTSKSRLFFFKSLQEDVTAAARKEATTGAGGPGGQKKNPKPKTGKSWGSLVHRSGSQLDETSQAEHVTRLSKRLTLRCDQKQQRRWILVFVAAKGGKEAAPEAAARRNVAQR
jgi:hypothetical protein